MLNLRVRRSVFVLSCLVTSVANPCALYAQGEPADRPTFRASVSVVPISATVRDARNRVVRELQKTDFEVLEGDQTRPVVDFSALGRGPVSVAVLFDTSGSMRGANLDTGRRVVHRLLDQLTDPADEAALFTFDKAIGTSTPFARDWEGIRRALVATEGWGVTSLYDAIAETARQVAQRPAERRAVVVVTDGIDNSSALSSPEVSALASAINVPVYVLSVAAPALTPNGQISETDGLSNLARWTGGELRFVSAAPRTPDAVGALLDELRQQYFLAIESASSSGWYRLNVRTKRKGLTVRARSGYFAATSGDRR